MRQFRRVQQRGAQQRNPDSRRRKETRDLELFDQSQQVVRHGLGRDDIAAADVNGRAKKYIQLRAVVKGQGMQGQVLLCNFCVDHTTHVLPQHRIVRQHGALGHRFGAAGVNNLRQILTGHPRLSKWRCASRQFMKIVHARNGFSCVF